MTPRMPLTIEDILAWADAHRARAGMWPNAMSGLAVAGPLGENWRKIDNALRYGLRGLAGGSSLAQLLAESRGHRNNMRLPRLTCARILKWARAHFKRHHTWPLIESGPIPESPGDDWSCIDNALRIGSRGLRPGRSLPRLLAARCAVRNLPGTPPLTVGEILAWADHHYAVCGKWPTLGSGVVGANPNETWHRLDNALRNGCRGLPGSMSLAKLLRGAGLRKTK